MSVFSFVKRFFKKNLKKQCDSGFFRHLNQVQTFIKRKLLVMLVHEKIAPNFHQPLR